MHRKIYVVVLFIYSVSIQLLNRMLPVLLFLAILINCQVAEAFWPFSKSIVDAVKNGDPQATEDLLKEDEVDINRKYDVWNYRGVTLLHIASIIGNADVIRVLIKYGALVNERSSGSLTPLHYAAMWGHAAAIKELCKNNADPNIKTEAGDTALHSLVHGVRWHSGNHEDGVSELIECGALINEKDGEGRTAFQYVKKYRGVDTNKYSHLTSEAKIANLLIRNGAIDEVRSKDGTLAPTPFSAPQKYTFKVTPEEYFIVVEASVLFKPFPNSITYNWQVAPILADIGQTLERVTSIESRVISEHVIELIDKGGVQLWVDNGLEQVISVIIDESVKDKVNIKPKTIQNVMVAKGIRQITVIDSSGGKIKDEKIDLRSGGNHIYALGQNTYKIDHQSYK